MLMNPVALTRHSLSSPGRPDCPVLVCTLIACAIVWEFSDSSSIVQCETGGQSVVSGYEGRATLEMIMAVYASHLQRRPVTFPLRDRTHPLVPEGGPASPPID